MYCTHCTLNRSHSPHELRSLQLRSAALFQDKQTEVSLCILPLQTPALTVTEPIYDPFSPLKGGQTRDLCHCLLTELE